MEGTIKGCILGMEGGYVGIARGNATEGIWGMKREGCIGNGRARHGLEGQGRVGLVGHPRRYRLSWKNRC